MVKEKKKITNFKVFSRIKRKIMSMAVLGDLGRRARVGRRRKKYVSDANFNMLNSI